MLGMKIRSVVYSEDRLVIILVDDNGKDHCLNIWAGLVNGERVRAEVVMDGSLFWSSKTVHC